MDAFIQKMHTRTVQERSCTEPKENPQEALRFAVAFEEGISQQKSFTGANEMKKEPKYAIDNKGKKPFWRCGVEFVQNHLMTCKVKNKKRRNCGINWPFYADLQTSEKGQFERNWQILQQRHIMPSKSNWTNNGQIRRQLGMARRQCGAETGRNMYTPFVINELTNIHSQP